MRLALVLVVVAASGAARADGGLAPAAIAGGLARVEARIAACGDKSQTGGTVEARVEVARDGKVTSATADGSGDAALDACVAEVLAAATFPATTAGGAFSYAFVFVANAPAVGDLEYDVVMVGIEQARARQDECHFKNTPLQPWPSVGASVGADGKVTLGSLSSSGERQLDACYRRKLEAMRLPKSRGGSFWYYGFDLVVIDPGELDSAAVIEGVSKVEKPISACARLPSTFKGPAMVKARVGVGVDGTVTSATADESGDAKRDACVAGVLRTATFKATKTGGAFTYPFWFSADSTIEGKAANELRATRLDRTAITRALATVKAKIVTCGDGSKVAGTVKAYVQVGPDGKAIAVSAAGSGADALEKCVAGVLEAMTFPRTRTGGSFTYPFVF